MLCAMCWAAGCARMEGGREEVLRLRQLRHGADLPQRSVTPASTVPGRHAGSAQMIYVSTALTPRGGACTRPGIYAQPPAVVSSRHWIFTAYPAAHSRHML